MKRTVLVASILGGLIGTAVLAQATAPESDAPTSSVEAAPSASSQAPDRSAPPMDDLGPMREDSRGFGPVGLAPLESYDVDGNGVITQQEITTRKAERFAAADADGDGALSPEELIALEDAIREEVRLARAARGVERMDDNGDGLLQAEELEARSPRLAPIFDELDTDGDDGISLDELAAGRLGHERGPHGFMGEGFGPGRRGHHD
ncbi:EF-hand domain-containing protein [Rubellimicrobium rubrum]|nr:EF-hand domain-containing protein [Rubellimicrobium rubrum]